MPSFMNQATLTYRNFVATSNVVTGEIQESLTAAKTAVSGDYRTGGVITYAISIVNACCMPYNDLTITDDLGAYAACDQTLTPLSYVPGTLRYFVNGRLKPCPEVDADCELTIRGIDVPGNSSVLLLYTAAVNQYAPLGEHACITNRAVIGHCSLIEPIAVSATARADEAAQLSIIKAINPTTVVGDAPMTYTFTIQNAGATAVEACDDVVVTDTFRPVLDIQCVTLNGKELKAGRDYTYDRESGLFATEPGLITVPAACYQQDDCSCAWTAKSGASVLTVSGVVESC